MRGHEGGQSRLEVLHFRRVLEIHNHSEGLRPSDSHTLVLSFAKPVTGFRNQSIPRAMIPLRRMSHLVRYEIRDGVAVITVDNPPVNALSAGVPEGISDGVERAGHDTNADAIVLIGAGSTFIAGADINIFKELKTREQSIERSHSVHTRLKRLEDVDKPLVAAIHGHALGGGLEFAMACHYRVAVATARVGQPEVLLGIIPGAGGTQRLPRLCGPALALEMCTDGKPIAAVRAKAAGILDAVIDGGLLEGAIAFAKARAAANERRRTRDLQDKIDDRAAGLAACQAMRTRSSRPHAAPEHAVAVDAIEACITLDFDAGSRREMELFADCVLSTESKAMRHLFFAEREVAKIPDVPRGHSHANRQPSGRRRRRYNGRRYCRWRTRMPAFRFC